MILLVTLAILLPGSALYLLHQYWTRELAPDEAQAAPPAAISESLDTPKAA